MREPRDEDPGLAGAAGDTTEGRRFMMPPSHRLFGAFDREVQAAEAAHELAGLGLAPEDVWCYRGEEGARRIDAMRPGPRGLLLRGLQLVLTNEHEYCDILRRTIRLGGAVLAIRAPRDDLERIRSVLRRHGAHHLSYGAHWNYVPVDGEGELSA